VYQDGGMTKLGIVMRILLVDIGREKPKTVVFIQSITKRYSNSLDSTDANFWSMLSLFKLVLGIITSKKDVISPNQIMYTCAYQKLPHNNFGIKEDGIIIWPLEQTSLPISDVSFA
jgi:hypothetical protein